VFVLLLGPPKDILTVDNKEVAMSRDLSVIRHTIEIAFESFNRELRETKHDIVETITNKFHVPVAIEDDGDPDIPAPPVADNFELRMVIQQQSAIIAELRTQISELTLKLLAATPATPDPFSNWPVSQVQVPSEYPTQPTAVTEQPLPDQPPVVVEAPLSPVGPFGPITTISKRRVEVMDRQVKLITREAVLPKIPPAEAIDKQIVTCGLHDVDAEIVALLNQPLVQELSPGAATVQFEGPEDAVGTLTCDWVDLKGRRVSGAPQDFTFVDDTPLEAPGPFGAITQVSERIVTLADAVVADPVVADPVVTDPVINIGTDTPVATDPAPAATEPVVEPVAEAPVVEAPVAETPTETPVPESAPVAVTEAVTEPVTPAETAPPVADSTATAETPAPAAETVATPGDSSAASAGTAADVAATDTPPAPADAPVAPAETPAPAPAPAADPAPVVDEPAPVDPAAPPTA
jgi:hypothetical protein